MPNSVDTEFFRPIEKPAASTRSIVSIANLQPRKRIDELIVAFDLALQNSDATLTIAGDGPLRRDLERLAAQLQSASRIMFAGALSRVGVRDLLQHADLLVSSSRSETFGVTLIEAMACGVPVVATASGGPNEIITSETGILVPVDDRRALIAALRKAIHADAMWDRKAIRDFCVEHYGHNRVAQRWTEIYEAELRLA
jgi:glycosyltransferase involved in cell wall biosynthesis